MSDRGGALRWRPRRPPQRVNAGRRRAAARDRQARRFGLARLLRRARQPPAVDRGRSRLAGGAAPCSISCEPPSSTGSNRASSSPAASPRALDRRARTARPTDLAKAELALSKSYAAYVRALRGARARADDLRKRGADPGRADERAPRSQAAASAPVARAARRRDGLDAPALRADARGDGRSALRSERQRRQICAQPRADPRAFRRCRWRRHVLIDTASARLWMYEDGRPVDSMRVVVGKPEQQTPMMAGFIRYAIVNPYWNVPDDLVRRPASPPTSSTKGLGLPARRRLPGAVRLEREGGTGRSGDDRLARGGSGTRQTPRVRQLPGGSNFMGKVKFMFPNAQGIYLHDTPDKHLLREDARQLSSGCVRLEDAQAARPLAAGQAAAAPAARARAAHRSCPKWCRSTSPT